MKMRRSSLAAVAAALLPRSSLGGRAPVAGAFARPFAKRADSSLPRWRLWTSSFSSSSSSSSSDGRRRGGGGGGFPPPRNHGRGSDGEGVALGSNAVEGGAQAGQQGSQNLMSRALVEESMLKENRDTLLMATEEERDAALKRERELSKKRRRGNRSGGGGFAASAKKAPKVAAHLEFNPRADKSGFGAIVMDEGVARIDGCLSKKSAEDLLAYVNRQLLDSIEEVLNGEALELTRFADVLGKKNRWDMLLPLEESPTVMRALCELLGEGTPLGGAIESIVGKDAQLYELASLISDPGAEQQVVHPDFPFQDTVPPALTCFVSLQDIDADMGPTVFLPRSATAKHHKELEDRLWDINSRTGLLADAPNKLNTLGAGDCSLYNPMTLHAGGANRSEKRRCLFYFSFKNPALNPSTEGASLRPELKERALTLKTLRKVLKKWKAENRDD